MSVLANDNIWYLISAGMFYYINILWIIKFNIFFKKYDFFNISCLCISFIIMYISLLRTKNYYRYAYRFLLCTTFQKIDFSHVFYILLFLFNGLKDWYTLGTHARYIYTLVKVSLCILRILTLVDKSIWISSFVCLFLDRYASEFSSVFPREDSPLQLHGKKKRHWSSAFRRRKIYFSTLPPSLSLEMTKQHRLRFSQMQFLKKNIKRSAKINSWCPLTDSIPWSYKESKERIVDIYRNFLLCRLQKL